MSVRKLYWIVVAIVLLGLAPFGISFVGLRMYLLVMAGTVVVLIAILELCLIADKRYQLTGKHPWELM